MAERYCPKCGAYWRCDCVLDDLLSRSTPAYDLQIPSVICDHDWIDAVGVEVDEDLAPSDSQVVVCRLCGLYSVHKSQIGG